MATQDFNAAHLNAQALQLRRQGLSYKEVARIMGSISQQRARQRALEGLRHEAIQQGKRYYHLKHDKYLNWR
jgi:transcriptional regulator